MRRERTLAPAVVAGADKRRCGSDPTANQRSMGAPRAAGRMIVGQCAARLPAVLRRCNHPIPSRPHIVPPLPPSSQENAGREHDLPLPAPVHSGTAVLVMIPLCEQFTLYGGAHLPLRRRTGRLCATGPTGTPRSPRRSASFRPARSLNAFFLNRLPENRAFTVPLFIGGAP